MRYRQPRGEELKRRAQEAQGAKCIQGSQGAKCLQDAQGTDRSPHALNLKNYECGCICVE
jgi:hypothetical protein